MSDLGMRSPEWHLAISILEEVNNRLSLERSKETSTGLTLKDMGMYLMAFQEHLNVAKDVEDLRVTVRTLKSSQEILETQCHKIMEEYLALGKLLIAEANDK